jgi:hypothetical protein
LYLKLLTTLGVCHLALPMRLVIATTTTTTTTAISLQHLTA